MPASSPSSPLRLLTDEQLVARATAGGREAFNELIVRHERRLFRFLSRTAPNAADVEDAMQQAFVKVYLELGRYNARWRFSSWLFAIALREIELWRVSEGAPMSPLYDENLAAAPTAETLDADDAGDLWSAAKRLLSTQQYTALWLPYGEGLPARDIAKILNRPRVWVSVSLHRACATLQQAVSESRTQTRLPREQTMRELKDKASQPLGGVA